MPLESELLGGEVDRLLTLGFGAVKQACYCLCSDECKTKNEERAEEALAKQEAAGAEDAEDDDGEEADDGEEDDEDEDEDEDEEGADEMEEDDEGGFAAVLARLDAPKANKAGAASELYLDTDYEKCWVSVDVKSVSGQKASCVCREREDDHGKPIKKSAKLADLRPAPPTKPPKAFEASLVPGALCELSYADEHGHAWWPMTVVKVGGGKNPFTVASEHYTQKHTVPLNRLRPAWSWKPGAAKWAQREPGADH